MSFSGTEWIKNIEEAAKVALGANNILSSEKRHEAEEVLLSFRRSKPNFHTCKMLLENSTFDTVQYQAAAALKDAIIREWRGLEQDMRNSLQQFVLDFIVNNQLISQFVRGILTQVLAIMIKMTTLDGKCTEHRQSLYACLTSLISGGDHAKQLIACSILSSLCIEFSITNKSSNVGIPWEQHGKSKKQFEEYDLKVIFGLILNVLRHIDSFQEVDSMFHNHNSLCEKFLSIAEQVLTWSFNPAVLTRRSLLYQAEAERVLLKPHTDWKEVLLDTSNIRLFFSIHRKCRQSENLCQLSVSCLAQLASLRGPVLSTLEEECHFMKHFVQETQMIYSNVHLLEHEAMGVANLCKNIIEAHKLEAWASSPDMQVLYQQFLNCITKLTCSAMLRANGEELLSDDPLYMESFEILLDTWTTITESINGSKNMIVPYAMQIVDAYIHCHISPPDGSRAVLDDSDVDIDELEEEDRERFSGQLMSIACLARISPESSMTLLSTFLEKRTDTLCSLLHSVQHKTTQLDSTVTQNLFEDLHWLVLVSGYVLADDIDGETALIPPEIVQCSIDVAPRVDQGLSMQVLGTPTENSSRLAAGRFIDPVIRMVAAVLRLCEITSSAIKTSMFECLSPQLTQDIIWLLRVWCRSYLLFREDFYKELSPVMSAAFGPDSEGGRWTVSYIVKTAYTILTGWTFEPKLLEDTTEMLLTMTESEKRCGVIASCEDFWKLGQDICSGVPVYDKLSPMVRHQLMSSLVKAGTSNMNIYREVFWDRTLNLIKARYGALTESALFKKQPHNPSIRENMMSIIDLLRGVAEASTAENSGFLFNFLSQFLEAGGNILYTYSTDQVVIVSVLELFVEVCHKQICYLHESKCRLLYEWILNLLQTFSSISKGSNTKEAEEDSFQDLSLVIELMTHLLTKDFIDFSESDTELHAEVIIHPSEGEASVADVVFYGLGIILPHINTELLSYPSLCCQYYKLVTFLCEIYPEKVEQLPHDVLRGFMYSLQIGLHSYGDDNCKLCLEAIQALTDLCIEKADSPGLLHDSLLPFVKLVFDVILVHATNMDLMRSAGDTFYSMFRFNEKHVMDLLSAVVASQSDPSYRQRLITEFTKLSSEDHSDGLNNERTDKTKFIKSLEDVIFNVREILCVK